MPAGYSLEQVLAERPDVAVVKVRNGHQVGVLRLERSGGEALAELAVLSQVRHACLATLVDHGPLPGGGRFVVREWIEGPTLGQFAAENAPEEVGRVVARLTEGLEHLHGHGLLHGDLKASNVLVKEGGQPCLIDYGLSAAAGQSTSVAGSLIHLPPELILGGARDERCDLFALGVTLALLLTGTEVDPARFHARFPGEPFLSAAVIPSDQLPEWARDIIELLTERDPSRRPPSARWVGDTLAARLGGVTLGQVVRPRLSWPCLEGRARQLREQLMALPAGSGDGVVRLLVKDPEETQRVGRALALEFTFSGEQTRGVGLRAEAERQGTSLALDVWIRELVESCSLIVLWDVPRGGWGQRAAGALARAVRQADARRLVVCDSIAERAILESAVRLEVPALEEEHVRRRLEEWIPDTDPERLATLASRIHAECAGSTARAEALTQALVDEGWLRASGRALQLRKGALSARAGRTTGPGTGERLVALSQEARRLVGAAVVHGRARTSAVLAETCALPPEHVLGALAEAISARILGPVAHGRLALRGRAPTREALQIEAGSWAQMHGAAAQLVTGSEDVARHAWMAGQPDARADLRAVAGGLREAGLAERALDLLSRCESDASCAGLTLDPVLAGEAALTWAAVGELDIARERALQLPQEADPVVQALALRTEARIAVSQQRHADASDLFRQAAQLDETGRPEAVLARARLLFDRAEYSELTELARSAPGLPRAAQVNLRALAAMGAMRGGKVDLAQAELEASLIEAEELGEQSHEAAVRLNLGILMRNRGELESAIGHLETALKLWRRDGYLPGVAQAQAMLGAALRDDGRLGLAETLLFDSAGARERLGDRVGAERARGIHALIGAERGHQSATASLRSAAARMREMGELQDAERLEAQAQWMAARGGAPPSMFEPHPDPRVTFDRARAAWLAEDREVAGRLLAAAQVRAEELGLGAVLDQCALLLGVLNGTPLPALAPTSAAAQDLRILGLLGSATLLEEQVLDLSRELIKCGRDDRAARLALSVVARGQDTERRSAANGFLQEALERVLGSAPEQVRVAHGRCLLGIPDPWLEDLDFLDGEFTEDFEVDVLRLLEINQRLVNQQELSELLDAIVESALDITGAERGFLALEQDGELHLDLAMDTVRGDLDPADVRVSETVLREALTKGEALRLSNASADPVLGMAPSVSELELRSIMCVPFDVGEGLRGVVFVDNRVKEGAFDGRAERVLGLLAGQAALAIRQVQRLGEIRDLNAALVQKVARRESDLDTAKRILADRGLTVPVDGMVGEGEAMRAVHELLQRLAPTDLTVLVCGESGTGKELAARALHDLSARNEGAFVSENCAALPASIIEAELFGHVKGAFTGAELDRPGLFERADGGTLFLDEIGDLPIELQAKLLRVLETRELRRLGDDKTREVDFRLVAATNRDLAADVEAGVFRADLLFRLDMVRVQLPPLGDRIVDIEPLVEHFLRLQRAKDGVQRTCEPEVLRALCERDWPGNVRELSNEVARLCVLSDGDLTDPTLIRPAHRQDAGGAGPQGYFSGEVVPLADLERRAILHALEKTSGEKRRAAELLGISRAKIYQRLKEWEASGDSAQEE